jgi:hypothetical protein
MGYSSRSKQRQQDQGFTTPDREHQSSSQGKKRRRGGNLSVNMQRLFQVLLLGVAGVLIFMNLKPYIEVAQMIVPQLAKLDILTLLTQIPIIGALFGWVFGVVGQFTASIIAVIVWGLIQTAQVAPLVWRADLNILNSSIQGVGKHRRFDIADDEGEALAKLKTMMNEAPTRFVKFWERAALVAYLVELAVVSFRFPPYIGGWDAIMNDFMVWSADKFDWTNALLLIVTMFGFEAIVRVLLWFYQRKFYFS